MLFTGIFCLLAGLAAASTAAVTTIIAAATETAQADAAPASGAGSAHDAAVTPIEKRNPKRVRPPNSNGIYKKRRHIHSYADKMQFAHCSAEILVFSSTGVKKGCDDLTASGLNLSQILTDVELLNPSLYKLLSMLADTDAAMRGAAAQAIIAAYKAACAVVICKPDMSVKGVRCILRTQKGIKVASKSAMQAPSAVVTISSLPHRTDGSDGGDNQQTCIPSSSRQQAPQLPGIAATSQLVCSPHAPAPHTTGIAATLQLFGSPHAIPQQQPGTTATSHLSCSPHAPTPQLAGTAVTSQLFGRPPLLPQRQPGTTATSQQVGSPHAPTPQLPGTTATSLLFGSPPLLPQRQPGTSATAQLVGSPHAPAPQLPGTTATPQLCDSLQQSYVDTVETDVGVRGNQPASQPRMQPARHVLFAGLREQLGVQAAATNRPFAPAVKMKRVGKGASKKLGLLGSPHPSPGHLLMPSTKRVVARGGEEASNDDTGEVEVDLSGQPRRSARVPTLTSRMAEHKSQAPSPTQGPSPVYSGDTTLSELAGKGLDDIEDHVERIMAGGKRELMMPLYQWLCKHLTGQQQQSSFFADLHKAVSKLPTKSLNA